MLMLINNKDFQFWFQLTLTIVFTASTTLFKLSNLFTAYLFLVIVFRS